MKWGIISFWFCSKSPTITSCVKIVFTNFNYWGFFRKINCSDNKFYFLSFLFIFFFFVVSNDRWRWSQQYIFILKSRLLNHESSIIDIILPFVCKFFYGLGNMESFPWYSFQNLGSWDTNIMLPRIWFVKDLFSLYCL